SREEAEKLAQELLQSGGKQWEELQENIRQTVGSVLSSMSIPRTKDIQDVKARIEKLEKRVSELEISSKRMMGED
ncbi:MAG TPA: phasin family protein, partial [Thermodesulfobacteriota bacterium]|nr:phasin family protein [Thermodesulfobacteriota bacterium]